MAHKVQCRVCHQTIDVDKETGWIRPVERMYYHQVCYDDFAKKKGAIKEGDLHVEGDNDLWYSAVCDYLARDIKMKVNYKKMTSQWNNLLKKGFTAKGIYFTLRYFYEIAKGDPEKAENGIGIVSYIYNEGTEYWGNRSIKDRGICDRIEAQIREFQAKKPQIIMRKEEYKPKVKTYSFEDVEQSEDEDDG